MDDHAGLILMTSIITIFYCLMFLVFIAAEPEELKSKELTRRSLEEAEHELGRTLNMIMAKEKDNGRR